MNHTEKQSFFSPDYVRSRRAYCLECAFEYFVSLLVTEAFLAKLLSSIGVNDSVIGIMSSLIVFAQLFQLFSLLVIHKIRNTKRFAILFHTIGQLFFMALYLVPFMPFAREYKTVIAVVCIMIAYFGNYFVTIIIYNWGNSHVDPHYRASYGAGKEAISLLSGMVVTLVVGYVMDYFDKIDNQEGGFIFAAISILIFCVSDFVCLLLIKNRIRSRTEVRKSEPFLPVLKKLFGMRSFWSILVLQVLWNTAQYVTVGFLGTYRIKELAFTVGTVQLINIVGNFSRAVLSRPFGRFSDKHSFASGISLGLVIVAVAFGANVFTTPETRFLLIVYTLLYCVGQAGIGANLLNITYSYIPRDYYVHATAIKNSVGGICGFVASLGASALLSKIQENGNSFLGISIYGQQVLSLISFGLIIAAFLFTHFVIRKQKVMIQ